MIIEEVIPDVFDDDGDAELGGERQSELDVRDTVTPYHVVSPGKWEFGKDRNFPLERNLYLNVQDGKLNLSET